MPKNGVPCSHAGCLDHVTHPCEGCGRIAGGRLVIVERAELARLQYMEAEFKKWFSAMYAVVAGDWTEASE